MSIWPFRRSKAEVDAERLLAAVTAASRNPALFGDGRIPDSVQGRFEAMAVHAVLALFRLRSEPAAEPLAQAFTDRFFSVLDGGLRETGVTDTAIPKRMHRLAGDFYGRLKAYSAGLEAVDQAALARALGRNILGDEAHPYGAQLAVHVLSLSRALAQRPIEALLSDEAWSPPSR